jgi:hypothetical protein
MRLQILDSARDDLIDGFYFYEKQEPPRGRYDSRCGGLPPQAVLDSAAH